MEHPDLNTKGFWLRWGRYPYMLAKLTTIALVCGGIYLVLAAIADVLLPVFLSLLLAYLLDPIVDWFENRKVSRTIAILICMLTGVLALFVFVLFLYPTVRHIIESITSGVPKLLQFLEMRAIPWAEGTFGWQAPASVSDAFAEYGSALQGQIPSVVRTVTSTLGDVWTRTGAIVASLVNLVLIPIFTFFFLRDFDRMKDAAREYLPQHNREWVLERIGLVDDVVGAWFRGQIQVAAIIGVLYSIGLGITFGVTGVGFTNGVAIGVVSGALNIVPYFGFAVGAVLAILLALLDWNGGMPLLGVLLTFAIVQGLEGYVITPRIVGEKIGLSPVLVIIVLLVGAELLGLLGVLLALPLAGALGVLLPDLVAWYKRSDLYLGQLDEPGGGAPPSTGAATGPGTPGSGSPPSPSA
jgi:predicted PurR-regulated permease PerM